MYFLHSLTTDKINLILACLVPGMIVLFVRSQFVRGQNIQPSTAILNYFCVSVIYFAVTFPVFKIWLTQTSQALSFLFWVLLIFIGPAILGILLGVNIQKDFLRRLLEKCKLNVVHSVPSAWDWMFGSLNEQWILVKLNDGTQFGGFYGSHSFASSNSQERDLYIQWIYDITDRNNWKPIEGKGVYIAASEIQSIETSSHIFIRRNQMTTS